MTVAAAQPQKVADHRFYGLIAAGLAIVVFVGFAPTYYLKKFFENDPLPLLVHIHGVVMTLWYALFVTQVTLVAKRRVDLHRTLGIAGVALAVVVAGMATFVSVGLARRRLAVHPQSTEAPFLLGIQLFSVVLVFAILIYAGWHFRRRPGYHKRLMTLAMLAVLGPAITRLPFIDHNIPATIAVSIGVVILCVVVDTIRNRHLHPAFGWGAGLIIGTMFSVAGLAQTQVWIQFVRSWLA